MSSPPALERFRLRSADGAELACYRGGAGPSLVLQPGALCDHTCWYPIWPYLAGHFTLVAFDRRGRGASDKAADNSIEREVEDLSAVIKAAGQPCHIFGHSAGAILALQAAIRGAPLASLMLYEPPATRGGPRPRELDVLGDQLRRFSEANDHAEALRAFLRATAGISEPDLVRVEAEPRWQAQIAMAPSLPIDVEISSNFVIDAAELGRLRQPVLVMYGEQSPAWLTAPARAIAAALPNSRLKALPNQGHNAIFSDPGAVAAAIISFVKSSD